MASSTFSDAVSSEDTADVNRSFTIVINENGEIDYDPTALQDIIGLFSIFAGKVCPGRGANQGSFDCIYFSHFTR
jgi:hypothetical protein